MAGTTSAATGVNPLGPDAVVGVVGAGTMGAGIAQVAAAAGHRVLLLDADQPRAHQAVSAARARLMRAAQKGSTTPDAAAAAAERLGVGATVSDLSGCDLVIEAIVEDLAVKRRLLADIEAVMPEAGVLASNTSSFSITALAARLDRPERVAGLHFFNPAPVMRLVEVVLGAATEPDVADGLVRLMTAWGKTAIRAASTPGFVVNRVARPFYGEALRLLDEQATDPATVDAALRDCGGFRMGPLELTDLIGQDVNAAVNRSVWAALGNDPRYTPSLAQDALVDAGRLGRKSGHGFYADGDTRPTPPAVPAVDADPTLAVLDGAVPTALLERLATAGVPVRRADGDTGTAVLAVTDGRTATDLAAQLAAPVALLDHCDDWQAATRVVLAVSDGCPGEALAGAVAALQRAGLTVHRVDDAPGLVVARTLAALVNAGVDAVARGVASATDVDLAMRHGANHPRGPLEWGDRLGPATVLTLLDHLEDTYRDGRYRASPLLRRHVAAGRRLSGSASTSTPDPARHHPRQPATSGATA